MATQKISTQKLNNKQKIQMAIKRIAEEEDSISRITLAIEVIKQVERMKTL